ncbi:MAG: BlaI/MecI/CopY family transcriptional regulator [Solobacterium sp.]|nr:BlaI/MecI/CopY family transcriptional regulator [Erysipelotrichaceae bacterium]MBQ9155078.1 BlaI/MecI/CopY family transcriptional regulator [Solobacterium sp.]
METLSDAESRIARIVWDQPGISSMDVWHLCEEKYGWKKSTVFTLIRRIREKELLLPQRSGLTMSVSREEYYHQKSRKLVEEDFNDSLGDFITSYMKDRKLSTDETQQLTALIARISENGTGE